MIKDNKLEIFNNFWIDENLKNLVKDGNVTSSDILITNSTSSNNFNIGNTFSNTDIVNRKEDVLMRQYFEYLYAHNKTIINWLKLWLTNIITSPNPKKVKKGVFKYENLEQFFKNIHNVVQDLKLDPKSVEFYTEAIESAFKNNQTALYEILTGRRATLLRELNLIKNKVTKYVDEDDIVKFYNIAKIPNKYLKLTWLRNYVRIIPKDVLDIKAKYDELGVFDNYVILHYDKNNDATELTVKEKEKAKDPILFGVVKESRKLFYVGDWVDEYCDLTMKQFLKTLEMKKIKEMSNTSIKKEISDTTK